MARKKKEETDEQKSDKKLLDQARDRLKLCYDAESDERHKMLDDLRFCTLDQWPAQIRKDRENDPNGARPCLTIDKINQYIAQVVNDMRQNRPAIKVRPVDDGADVETAKVFAGIIRHIEDQSNASVAYETAGESQTRIGLGYLRVITQFSSPESFDQDIFIRSIPDTFSVYLSPHLQPDGSDAEYGFVLEDVAIEVFEREHPQAKTNGDLFLDIGDSPSWRTEKTIKRAEYFYKEYETKELLFLTDGTTIFADQYDGPAENIVRTRKTETFTVKWCKLTGIEILKKEDWAGKYIPIIEVTGKEAFVEGRRVLWGLVRPAKDNLRMYNYWASAITEKIGLSPKTPFIGAKGQFAGVETQWKNANKENRAYLEYEAIDINGNALPAPKRPDPAPIETAMVQMMSTIEHDVQASLGMFRAAVGESQGQQSGRALLALERSSDTGTFNFPDNLSRSIRYVGKILVDIIPKIIDTKKIQHILGEDGESSAVHLDPEQQQSSRKITGLDGSIKNIYNLGAGTFDVSVTSGPSYNTKRMEAAAVFTDLAKGASDPASAAVMRYLTVKNSDFTSSEEAISALKALLPPPVLHAISTDDNAPIPPKAQAALQQLQQQDQQLKEALQKLQQENMMLKSGAQTDMAKVNADAQHKQKQLEVDASVQVEKQKLAREDFEFNKQLSIDKENLAIDLAERKAQSAHKISEAQFKHGAMLAENEAAFKKEQLQSPEAKTEQQESTAISKLATVLSSMESTFKQLAQTITNPPDKKVTIGAVQRDKNGNITGADIRQTLQ